MNKTGAVLSHDEVFTLMPGFVNGTLDSGLQRRVQEHVATCPGCALRHREDLELHTALARPPTDIEILLTSSQRERNRERLLARIERDGAVNLGEPVPTTSFPKSTGRPLLGTLPLGAAAALLLAALLLPTQMLDRNQVYQTQTSTAPGAQQPQGFALRVVFQSDTPQEVITQLLMRYGAERIDGPSPAGVYTLAFPGQVHSESELLSLLRQQPEIALAERRIHRDG